ncbi:MAG: RNA recognition motif domain-containing protein [bacterium]
MQSNKLYVGNLNYTVTNQQLEELFATYGEIRHVKIIEGKGFGFVEMADADAAENAKNALNNIKFEGRIIKVDKARPQANRQKRRVSRY